MKINLINKIDDWLLKSSTDRIRSSHYPSQASAKLDGEVIGKCLRAQWYSFKGVPKSNPADATAMWKFKAGDSLHELFPLWLGKVGFQVAPEVSFQLKPEGFLYPISGRIDCLIEIEKELVGVEIKSTYGQGLTNKVSGVKYAGAKPDHLAQIVTYLATGKLEKFILIYLARDNFYRMQFDIEKRAEQVFVDGEPLDFTFADIAARWRELEGYISKNEIAPRDYWLQYPEDILQKKYEEYLATSTAKKPYDIIRWGKDKGDWQCSYCDYSDYCWKGEIVSWKTL